MNINATHITTENERLDYYLDRYRKYIASGKLSAASKMLEHIKILHKSILVKRTQLQLFNEHSTQR